MKTRKDLDGGSEDVETHRTCQRGLEFFHLLLEEVGSGRLMDESLKRNDGNGSSHHHHPNTKTTPSREVSGGLSFV